MHTISIPQEVIEACMKRRGKLQVFNSIDCKKTALVIIDMQKSWIVPGLSPLEIPKAKSIAPNINCLADSLRKAGGIVAWTQSTFDDDWTKDMYKGFVEEKWINQIIETTKIGSEGFQIWEEMEVNKEDIISIKTRPSALIQGSSNLDSQLRKKNCDTLIITGTLTNACCESTTRDAVALGYKVIFVSDGTATRSDIEHNATLINLMQLVADVRTTKEVIQIIDA